MSDFPEDIMKAANAVAEQMPSLIDGCDCSGCMESAAFVIAEAIQAERNGNITCGVSEMKTSARTDYFVSIKCDGREITPHMFRERWKAEYEVAEWKWLFGQGEKPDLMGYWPEVEEA